ncbi:MAG TPA: biotin carboxylase N-terminal domain-containing protein [Thermoanaerobaculia bacterium]|nr:biotin carboxylase N-terminal domain-containing protein [Thermoanaerobaculia bacterium]
MTRGRAFRRVLVANRGEIAVRVIRACRAAGLESVAVHSDADAAARHVALADDAAAIGPAPAKESYLSIPRLLAAAKETRCDAVHPGYGFLSESADFARAVEAAGLVWIGPPPEAMEAMGRKISARERMKAAGVPVVPGALIEGSEEHHGISSNGQEGEVRGGARRGASRPPAASGTFKEISSSSLSSALSLGLPVVVKASAGGGGKGMRIVRDPSELSAAVASCRREAAAAFGDPTVYVEKYLEKPRHVEVQIFGDGHGNVVAIGERECSLQRRHQKVVEECPSPAVTPELRARLAETAVDAARAVGYVNAGTVEFLLLPSGAFFFLEMNTRLQVEHPVTEEAFGVDLVLLQLAVAAGRELPPLPRAAMRHSMEARVYAEDPEAGFLPQTGRVLAYREPSGPGIRVESGLAEGQDVGLDYDPLLAKIVASGATRDEARRRLAGALSETVVLGVSTNAAWLRRLLETPEVVSGAIHTSLVDGLRVPPPPVPPPEAFAAAAAALSGAPPAGSCAGASADPFDGRFRTGGGA